MPLARRRTRCRKLFLDTTLKITDPYHSFLNSTHLSLASACKVLTLSLLRIGTLKNINNNYFFSYKMFQKKRDVAIGILALLLIPLVSAGFFERLTGFLSLEGLLQTRRLSVHQASSLPCKISVNGKCFIEPLKSPLALQENASIEKFRQGEQKIISGKRVNMSKTDQLQTKTLKVGRELQRKEIPLVHICLDDDCKDHGLDEVIDINGVLYNMAIVDSAFVLIPRAHPLPVHDEEGQIATSAEEPTFVLPEGIRAPAHIFKVGFVIDRGDYPDVTEENLLSMLDVANAKLGLREVRMRFQLHDMVDLDPAYDIPSGTEAATIIDDYLSDHSSDVPNGVVILRGDNQSNSFGGYTATSSNLALFGFENSFASPLLGNAFIYGSVIDYDQVYAGCGYDSQGNHISNVSIIRDDGAAECANSLGVPCVFYNGAYRCSNFDLDNNEYAQSYGLIGNVIIHEFLHSFHPWEQEGGYFHFCNPAECPSSELSLQGISCDLQSLMHYSGMCPVVWEEFARGWNLCSSDPLFGSTLGLPCRQNCDCGNNQRCDPVTRICIASPCNPQWNDCDSETAECSNSGFCVQQAVASEQQTALPKTSFARTIYSFFLGKRQMALS